MAGEKPAIKVSIVRKDKAGPARDIAAGWVNDDGRIGARAGRDIVAIKFSDGSVMQIADCYVNIYDNRGEQQQRAPRPGASTGGTSGFGGSAKHTAPKDTPDFGSGSDDDIPFARPYSTAV